MTNRTTSNKMLSVVAIAAMMVATATIAALVTQPVAAQNISIPTDNNQSTACDTAGLSSAISDSCNSSFTNNVTNSGGVLNLAGTGGASISIPFNNTQASDCETGGAHSAISASCNNNATNNVANSGGEKVRS
jgi:opacity protein-like surface antigen